MLIYLIMFYFKKKAPNDDTSILHTASFFNNKFNNLYGQFYTFFLILLKN